MWNFGNPAMFLDFARDGVQILILAWVLYFLYEIIADTKITQVVPIIILYALGFGVCYIFHFDMLLLVYRHATLPLFMFLCVLYHPELRRSFSTLATRRGRFFRMSQSTSADQIDSILAACESLVEKKRGALIIFPRHTDIKTVIDSGTRLNAELSSALINTIFDHDTPLHDGAVVVQGGRIIAASCYLPLSEQTNIRASFGTRHRAALGLSEESDAVIIIVSEESGAISLAYNANIYYDLTKDTIKRLLLSLFNYHDVRPQDLEKEKKDEEAKQVK